MSKQMFQKYYRRVAREGVVKSFLIALVIACGILTVAAFCSWFFGFKGGLWLAIGLFAAALGGLTPLVYFKKFRPSTKAIARRVDELGLEERVLTMTELENDTSFIAMKQREDTEYVLRHVDHMLIKVVVSAALIAVTAVVGVFAAGMTTVNSLYVAGVIPSGIVTLNETIGVKYYNVSYTAELTDEAISHLEDADLSPSDLSFGGVYLYDEEAWSPSELFGDAISVKGGDRAPAVLACAERGFVFVRWSDGSRDPYRSDVVNGNLSLVAFFDIMPNLDLTPPELPDPSQNTQQGQGQGEGDGDQQQGGNDPSEGGPGGDDAGGSPNSANRQIIDGQTYYGYDFENAYDEAQDRLGTESGLDDEKKDWANNYFESIEGGSDSEGGN